MWIARTSKYTYTLLPNGQFSKSDSLGSVWTLSNCITAPKDNFIAMLPGLDDFGNEVICLIRMPSMYSGPHDCVCEMYRVNFNYWTSESLNTFYKYTNLDHMLAVQKRLAEEILLGQA